MIAESQEHLIELIRGKKWNEIQKVMANTPPSLTADLLEELPKEQRVLFYRALPRDLAADTFAYLDDDHQTALLKALTDQETRHLLENLSPDDRTTLLAELPAAATHRLLNLLGPEDLKEAKQLLGYPENSVGRLMSPDYAEVQPEQTVEQALASIRHQAKESETLNIIYVVDDHGKLLDEIRLRRFITASPSTHVRDLMDGTIHSLSAFDDQEKAVGMMRELDYFALPVTDSKGILIGVVTADDVLDVAAEEATEDFHRVAAVSPFTTSLLKTRFLDLYGRRVGWLVLLVFVNIWTGAGIAYYEELIESVVALVFFLPMLIASGGNAGAQASTLVVRSLALGEIRTTDYLRIFFRETTVSITLGMTMALAVYTLALWRSGPDVALAVALSMVAIVFIGSMIGMSLPFILNKFKLDPATASAPLVTSLADITGVLIYLGIASLLLSHMIG